jgi:hypothetical protein
MTQSSIQDSILQVVNEGMASTKGSFSHTGDYKINGAVSVSSLTVETTLDVGTIRATKIVTLEGSNTELGNYTAINESELDGRGLRFTAPNVDSMLVYRAGNKIWTNSNFDIDADRSYHIDSTQVLSINKLGPTVTQSSLRQVGTLNKLQVSGDSILGDFAYFSADSGRLGLNTESPNGTLSIVTNNIEVIVGSDSIHRAKVGTYTNDHLDIVTDDTTRITITNSGEVVIGDSEYRNGILRVNGKLYVDEIIADTRLSRSTSLTFETTEDNPFYGKGIEWVATDRVRKLVLGHNPDRIYSTESIDLAKDNGYYINNQLVLAGHALGPAVIESNLIKVGVLQDLTVAGTAQLSTILSSDIQLANESNRLSITSIGVLASNAFTVVRGQDSDLVIDGTAISIGHKQNHNRPIRLFGRVGVNVSNPDSSVDLAVGGNISFGNKKFTNGDSAPQEGVFSKGDICWNTDPAIGNYVGWVCIVEGTPGEWRPFGVIA